MTEFNWQPRQLSNSFYRDYDVPPIYPVTPNINSIVQGIFDIAGTEVFNLSRTHLDFDLTVAYPVAQATQAGGVSQSTQVSAATVTYSYTALLSTAGGGGVQFTLTAPAFTASVSATAQAYPTLLALHLGKICPIQSIIFQTDSNIQLVNLTNAQQQSTSMYLPQTSIEKWLDRDLAEQGPAAVGVVTPISNRGDLIAPIRKPSYQQISAAGLYSPGAYSNTLANASSPGGVSMNIGAEPAGQTLAPLPNGAGELACATLISTTSGAQGTITMRYRINLGDYKNTLFALNKDLFFNRRMRMIINFEGLYHWGFTYQPSPNYVTPTNSFVGAADFTSALTFTLSNVTLRLALQSNETVASMVRQQVAIDGLRMLFPFTLCTNFTASAITSQQQFQVPINASLGQRLLRVYSVALNGSNIGAAFCSNDNSQPATALATAPNNLYTQIQTKLNARFMQDSALALNQQEDYRFLKEMLRGSALTCSDAFYQKSFFVDNFTSGDRSHMWDDDNTSIGGLELKRADGQSVDYVYSLIVTSGAIAGTMFYIFPVVQRELVITKDNVLMI